MTAFELGAFSPEVKPDVSGTCPPVQPDEPTKSDAVEPLFKCGAADITKISSQPAITWTPDRVEQLERLFLQRLPAAEIGRRLGLSKNSVIGKLHRLALAGPQKPYEPPHDVFNGGGCLWPHGDPGEPGFGFCGAEPQRGKPYCPRHCVHAYRQSEEMDDAIRT